MLWIALAEAAVPKVSPSPVDILVSRSSARWKGPKHPFHFFQKHLLPCTPLRQKEKINHLITQLKAAVRGKWFAGGFCSTHRHGVSEGHTIGHCNYNSPVHVDSSNHKNPVAPRKYNNKGWDTGMFWRGGPAVSRIKTSFAVTANSSLLQLSSYIPTIPTPPLPPSNTDISDTSASGIYLTPSAPCANVNPSAVQIFVVTAGGPPNRSSESCDLLLPSLPVRYGHIMPNFHHNLMGISQLCDHKFRVMFDKTSITVYIPDGEVLLRVWCEPAGNKLWRFSLHPQDHPSSPTDCKSDPVALNSHDLPSIVSLVRYLHVAAGFQVNST